MQSADVSPQTRTRSLLGVVRLVAALAVIIVATLGVLVVLDVLPDEMLTRLALKVLIVAAIAVATIGVVSLLVSPQRDR